jgi:hypothetical protein
MMIFCLAVECGPEKHAAELLGRHFGDPFNAVKSSEDHARYLAHVQKRASKAPDLRDEFTVLAKGARHACDVCCEQHSGAWWVTVWISDVTENVGPADHADMFNIVLQWYDRLRSAPPYRFAVVGIEAGTPNVVTISNIKVYLEENDDTEGMVLAEAVWKAVGSPDRFIPFSPRYRWCPVKSGADLFR